MTDYLKGGNTSQRKLSKNTLDLFVVQEGILYFTRCKPNGSVHFVLVVLQSLKQSPLNFSHVSLSGHLGQYITMLKTEEYFY